MFILSILPHVFFLSNVFVSANALNIFDFNLRKSYINYVEENGNLEEDAVLTVPQLLTKYGYPCEEHKVVTPDGYILTMHRIPYGRSIVNYVTTRPVAFLQHGLLASSADWIIAGTEKGLAYILADAGYDVWMGNVRGNTYSRNHSYLDPDDKAFWQFSWHEIGIFDLPTMIDYILAQTQELQLTYVGHSQGTTTFFVMCSELPSYNYKIKAQFSLAPVAYSGHITSPLLKFLSYFNGNLGELLRYIGVHEFLPQSSFTAKFAETFCDEDDTFKDLCSNVLFVICGFDKQQFNETLLPVVLGHSPAGAATLQLMHYAQLIRSGKFRRYDYGISGNYQRYGSMSPPKYNLKKVTAPVHLFHSTNDWLAAEEDVLRLYRDLGNPKSSILVPHPKFNHLDYVYAIDVKSLLYDLLVKLMNQYQTRGLHNV